MGEDGESPIPPTVKSADCHSTLNLRKRHRVAQRSIFPDGNSRFLCAVLAVSTFVEPNIKLYNLVLDIPISSAAKLDDEIT